MGLFGGMNLGAVHWIANAFKEYFWVIIVVIGFFWLGSKMIRR